MATNPSMIKNSDLFEDLDSLVNESAQGSTAAFAELVETHNVSVRMFLSRFGFDANEIDDLAQDAFVTAFRKIKEFRGESAFSTWLLGIARNHALSFLRSRRRQRSHEQRLFDEAIIQAYSRPGLAEAGRNAAGFDAGTNDQEDLIHRLDACLDQVQPNARKVVDWYYTDNLSSDEIAKRLSKRPGAIRMMLTRIRKALYRCIQRMKSES